MKTCNVQNGVLAANLLAWGRSPHRLLEGSLAWSARVDLELSDQYRTLVHVWAVDVRFGVSRHRALVVIRSCAGEESVELCALCEGDWDSIVAVYCSTWATFSRP